MQASGQPDSGGSGPGAGLGWLAPYLLLCLAPILWGWSGVLVRWAGLPGNEQVIVLWRSVFALGFYAAAILLGGRPALFLPGRHWTLLLASGLLTAGFAICAFKAYNLLSIGTATFIIYLAPVLVAALAPLVLAEKLRVSTVLCLGIAFAGIALFSIGRGRPGGRYSLTGSLLALAGAVCWAALMLIWKRLRQTDSPLTVGLWTNVTAAVVFAPFAAGRTHLLTAKGWGATAAFGVISIGAAGLLFLYAIKRVRAQDAALLSYIEPVSAMALGFLALAETPRIQDLAGAFLILAAGTLLVLFRGSEMKRDARRARSRPPTVQ